MTPEGRVKARVKKALASFGSDVWAFMPVQTGYGVPALDFLTSIRGRFVAIETKVPGKKLTPLQETTKAAMEAAGAIVMVIDTQTVEEIIAKIWLALEFSRGQREAQFPVSGTQAQGILEQHLRPIQSGEAPEPAAGGDHGAPRTAPVGRSKSPARLKN